MDGIITRDQSSKWQKSLNGDATIGFRRTIGANKTFQQKHGNRVVLGESAEFRRLRHAVERRTEIATKPSAASAAFTA
jgi:hypothetical protein